MNNYDLLDTDLIEFKNKSINLFILFLLLILIGGFVGTSTNSLNVILSQEYYQRVMGWELSYIWRRAVLQGLLEGLVYGFLFGAVYTFVIGLRVGFNISWTFVRKQVVSIAKIIYMFWLIGGIVAIFLAFVFPHSYDQFIISVPQETLSRIRYAWVGGSIWGGIIGGLIATIRGIFTMKIHAPNN